MNEEHNLWVSVCRLGLWMGLWWIHQQLVGNGRVFPTGYFSFLNGISGRVSHAHRSLLAVIHHWRHRHYSLSPLTLQPSSCFEEGRGLLRNPSAPCPHPGAPITLFVSPGREHLFTWCIKLTRAIGEHSEWPSPLTHCMKVNLCEMTKSVPTSIHNGTHFWLPLSSSTWCLCGNIAAFYTAAGGKAAWKYF